MEINMSKCYLCPRNCGTDRTAAIGFCGTGNKIKISRAALHQLEEPCISFKKGSGTIFFAGCNLHCVYCQNKKISDGSSGIEIPEDRFYDILFELKNKGAENINLVTAGHFISHIIPLIKKAKQNGLDIPVVYNTSSYEKKCAIKKLEGIADIYLPDLKYISSSISEKYSSCSDYFKIASEAIDEMVNQKSECIFTAEGKLISGVIVRHLVLPENIDESKKIIKYLHGRYGNSIYMSIMSQFTPVIQSDKYPELNRKLTTAEYNDVIDYAIDIGVENAFIQEGESASESFIPEFNFEGVRPDIP